jgi:hypothetical protein
MRIFIDTEFLDRNSGDHKSTQLISIGAVKETGEEFHMHLNNYDIKAAWQNKFLRENVLPHVALEQPRVPSMVANELRRWSLEDLADGERVEFIAYYGAFDWYLICKLMSGFLNLPAQWRKHYVDLRVLLNFLGHADVKQPDTEGTHNALYDAKWNKEVWDTYIDPHHIAEDDYSLDLNGSL